MKERQKLTNILIIEDDEDIREGVRILLEGEQYQVQEAENGRKGLQLLTKDTDLVILDIMMPGMSGFKTCEEIRKISYVPVLFLTAKSQESDKLLGLMAGETIIWQNPFLMQSCWGESKLFSGVTSFIKARKSLKRWSRIPL